MKRRPLRMHLDSQRHRRVKADRQRAVARWERRNGKQAVEEEEEEVRMRIHTTGIFVAADDVTTSDYCDETSPTS